MNKMLLSSGMGLSAILYGLEYSPIFWSHVEKIAMVPYISNIPQHDVGK